MFYGGKDAASAHGEFQGQLMRCHMCGKLAKSHPDRCSDWRLLRLDNKKFYFCTDHFPPDGSSIEAFTEAYKTIGASLDKPPAPPQN